MHVQHANARLRARALVPTYASHIVRQRRRQPATWLHWAQDSSADCRWVGEQTDGASITCPSERVMVVRAKEATSSS